MIPWWSRGNARRWWRVFATMKSGTTIIGWELITRTLRCTTEWNMPLDYAAGLTGEGDLLLCLLKYLIIKFFDIYEKRRNSAFFL